MENFWDICAEEGVVVIPFIAYSEYLDGNEHESKKLGLKFVALPCDTSSPIKPGEFYISIDEDESDPSFIANTPEEALELRRKAKKQNLR
jgi:hypothetical protein